MLTTNSKYGSLRRKVLSSCSYCKRSTQRHRKYKFRTILYSICIYIIDSGDQVSRSRNLIFYQLYHVHVRVFSCDKLALCKSASSVFPFFLSSFKISGFLKDESARTDNTVDVIKVTTDSLISCFCLVITVITHRLLSYQNCCILLKSVI